MVSPSAPLDQYSFVESEDEYENAGHPQTGSAEELKSIFAMAENVGLPRMSTVDSGVGSECSHSFAPSPTRLVYANFPIRPTNFCLGLFNMKMKAMQI